MNKLPIWAIHKTFPHRFDLESSTPTEMVGRLYGAIQNLIDEHNDFIEQMNEEFAAFKNDSNSSNDEFKRCCTTLLNNYIKVIDDKVSILELYIKENLAENIKSLIENGELDQSIVDMLSGISNTLTTITSDITAINTRLTEVDTAIKDIADIESEHITKFNEHEVAIAGLESEIAGLESEIAGLETEIATFDSKLPYYVYNEETESLDLMNVPTKEV